MPNMSYCRFQNTFIDLMDCYSNMNDDDLSISEWKARKNIINVCKVIIDEYEELLNEEYQPETNND